LSPTKSLWPLFSSAIICLLAACGSGEPDRKSSPRGASERLPGGESSLPLAAVRVADALSPTDLYQRFEQFQVGGLRVHLAQTDGQPELLLIEVDLELFEPVLVGSDGDSRSGLSAGDAITNFELDLVIGSSFVSEVHSLTPVGLLQIEGRIISELQGHGYTRVLGARADGLGVVASREYHRGMFESAMQVGPGIVEHGVLDISERDLQRPKYFRTFVGTCGSKVIIGASQTPMHLYTLGQRLLQFVAGLGESCDEVVNLAGDREVVLAIASADRSRLVYFGHPQTAKAALLGFRRKALVP
jgi:hypothetical protein